MTSGGTVELQSLGKHHKQHLNSGRVTLNDKFERWGRGGKSYSPTTGELVCISDVEASESPFQSIIT